jgi:g-D-glutamyl-meso-diaminopimelate peptidase
MFASGQSGRRRFPALFRIRFTLSAAAAAALLLSALVTAPVAAAAAAGEAAADAYTVSSYAAGGAAAADAYTVSYDAGGGTGAVDPVRCEKGGFVALAWPDGLTGRDGLAFGGWKDGDGKIRQPGEMVRPSGDAVYTAVWVRPVTVYIDPAAGKSTNSGKTPSSPVSSITDAQSKVKSTYGYYGSVYSTTFVFMSPFETSSKGQTITVPVTITAAESTGGESDGDAALLTLGGTVLAKAPVWFRDISMKDSGSHNLCACGNPVRFTGISTPDGYTAANLFGAGSSVNYPAGTDVGSTAVPTSLFIESGSFNFVYGGGNTVSASDVCIEFSGGRAVSLFGGGNSAGVTGDVVVRVSGGSVGSLTAGGRASGVEGGCRLYIDGGEVASVSEGCGNGTSVIKKGTTVGCSGEFVPVSYSQNGAVGTVKVDLQYRFGDTMRLAYPDGLYLENRGLYRWTLGGRSYAPGDRFETGDTYLVFTPEWRVPYSVWVDQKNGSDSAKGTKAAPVRTLAAAYALLRDADGGGSVYTNVIHIVGTYKADAGEQTGGKPASLTDGTLELFELTAHADLRVACAVTGWGVLSSAGGNVRIEHRDACIGQIVSAGGVSVAAGHVRTVSGGGDLTVCGGTVDAAGFCGDIRLGSGTLGRADESNGVLTVTGGKLGGTSCAKTEILLTAGRSLEITGPAVCASYTGGGKLAITGSGKLEIGTHRGSPTEITAVPELSGAVAVSSPGSRSGLFYGAGVLASDGEWKTGTLVTWHLDGQTGRVFAEQDGSFTLPDISPAAGYSNGTWYTDAAMTRPYTGAPAAGALELWSPAAPNGACTLYLSTTSGSVGFGGREYSSALYSDMSSHSLREGSTVTLTAKETSSAPFICWLDETAGRVVSTGAVLEYRLSGDVRLTALFGNAVGNNCTVLFCDGGRVVSSLGIKRGSKLSEDQIPQPLELVPGRRFSGWDRPLTDPVTDSVIISAVYEAVPDRVTQTYTGAPGSGTASDGNGASAFMTAIVSSGRSVTFVCGWSIPDGFEAVRAGIEIESPDGRLSYTSPAPRAENAGTYYLTKGSAGGTEWRARAYACYASPDGRIFTVRGETVTGSCGAAASDPVSASVHATVALDGGETVSTSMREFYESVVDTSDDLYLYDEMADDLRLLAERHADKNIRLVSIGKSVLGRDLWVMEVGNAGAPYRMFVRGSDHAREFINTVIVMKTLEFYLENWYNTVGGERVCDIFDSLCICFEPMANPDGVMLSQLGLTSIEDPALREKYAGLLVPIMMREQAKMVRGIDYDDDLDLSSVCDENGIWWGRWAANINGVDLHRDYFEETLKMYNTAFRNYLAKHQTPDIKDAFGSGGLSQPETQAVAAYVARYGFNMSFTYHSYSPCLQLPTALCEAAQLEKNYELIGLLSRITSYNLNSNTGTSKATGTNAGYNNWFICKYPHTACFTIETGYKQVGGASDNTPLKMVQIERLFPQNRMGPVMVAMSARDSKAVDALD